jgi:hypothetical protein
MASAQIEEVKPTKYGFEVRRVANGFIVHPPRVREEYGRFVNDYEIHVFGDMTALAAWLLAQEAKL